ncbi:uracil-DNA glycosylase [Aquibacillus koreensis]|uniref:Uracil-DNA glycosylase n=1 Tax=Aquibacillus koreensis TaxID=279446 RepID=A0A9X4ALS2_9BACI|nr:uracil-DNA glycosylase [Aquibacillus koreensis]MCT2536957.1 uracil-DNA glycosylase [Aquibacillus koreensis]MDC3422740.1 uracil-DNA glycosylase [Aquibacillus koreensis]
MIIAEKIHPSWQAFLTPDVVSLLENIEKSIGTDFNPTNRAAILKFLSVDLNKVKVVWLGQDVYPAKGVATGRAFEVGGLESWNQTFKQVSIKNIVRLVHKNYLGIENYSDIRSFQDIKSAIESKEFPIKPPNEWFQSLEQQGVLFLNVSFTCRVGKANSHKKLWEPFSDQVIQYISKNRPSLRWFLWGNEAKSYRKKINNGVYYESRHPMMCSEKYEDDFLKSQCFLHTWDLINWLG